ncbi:hypothetical protein [Paenibacillus gallinarum]|uniref:Uncharacterized protein n=1 Tax=Paenibacillus gallinarum TaxID=2762232 RepID=A0ABR8SWB1_9BACL|nr:hypothetical protein [Paenibacillus gallinarum]MBD7967775.1 hypothetical protein [Paenibacillus gallinarum]
MWNRLFKRQREIEERLEKRTRSEKITVTRYINASEEFQKEIKRNHFFPYLVVERGNNDR